MTQKAAGQTNQTVKAPAAAPQPLLQRACACGRHTSGGGDCAECRRKGEGALQRSASGPATVPTVPPIVHDVLRSSGRALDPSTRAFMEPRFGHDFSGVRVHTDDKAATSARAVNALAYTVGSDIIFDRQRYAPGTHHGDRLLAHELTHVVQQSGSGTGLPTRISQPSDAHESEADTVADAVFHGPSSAQPVERVSQAAPLQRAASGVLSRALACQETGRLTSPEHQLIQSDYQINVNVNSAREYAIPESAENGIDQGYADLVDLITHGIYDVKNPSDNLEKSKEQVMRYLVKAEEHCDSTVPWHFGVAYPSPRIVTSYEPDTELIVEMIYPGILQYTKRKRQRARAPAPDWTAIVLLLAVLAAIAAAEAAKQAGKKNPILVLIQVLAVAAVLVLSERQAKAGENPVDDDPLVAVAQMFDDTGHPMPPEIRKLVEEDPALRELLRIEVERRRRSGAKPDTHLPAGAAGAASGTTPGADASRSAGAGVAAGSGGLDKPASKPPAAGNQAAAGNQKAAVPSPDVPNKPAEKESAGAAAQDSYWQSLQIIMDRFDYSSLGSNNSQIIWPPDTNITEVQPKQKLSGNVFGRNSGLDYVFSLDAEVVSRTGRSITFRVQWCGGMLTSRGQRMPPPSAYHPGAVIVARDPAGQ